MSEERILDIMLDLEFLGTEEDMIREYPAEDAFPIVTSIGIVASLNNEVKYSKNFALNFQEQLDNGAKFGKRCMLEFWTKQALLGEELARTISETESIHRSLTELAMIVQSLRLSLQPTKVNVYGNNLLADNSKVVRLFAKYAYTELPWSYHENADYRELLYTAVFLGFNKKAAEAEFEQQVYAGALRAQGFTAPALHNAEYDCLKQLNTLHHARMFLDYAKEHAVGYYHA